MATIEERFAQTCLTFETSPQYTLTIDAVKFATEQDRIAREDERERCISIVEQFFCTRCAVTNKAVCKICESKTLIRKAMMEE